MRALETRPADPSSVAESFLLKLQTLTGFHPSLTGGAGRGDHAHAVLRAGGGGVCAACAEDDASPRAPTRGRAVGAGDAERAAGGVLAQDPVRREAGRYLFGFTEYHLERRIKSLPMLARSARP